MAKARVSKFPVKPDPEPPAHSAPVPPRLGKVATITYRASERHERLLTKAARYLGVSRSSQVLTLAEQYLSRVTKTQGTPRHPLLDSIDELREEAELALADNRIDATERARLTEIISEQLHGLWERRAA